MNAMIILAVSLPIFWLGYRFYARWIEKIFDVDESRPTPAVEINDGVDYVPTRNFVLFGHHFSSIAGGGPIIGPTVGLIFGYLPVWLWVVIGTLVMGAVHDFTALLASIREQGKSMAEVAEATLGRTGFLLFVGFTIIMLLMVTSAFLGLTVTALTSKYPTDAIGLAEAGGLLRTVVENGVEYAVIGGIASTSVIVITFCAPILGFLLYKKQANPYVMGGVAIAVCLVSIQIGLIYPVAMPGLAWMIILSVYSFASAGLPVWLILQPRDFTNSFLLYGGILTIIIASAVVGFSGETMASPALNIADGNAKVGAIWPILFITVACGAISGFHALVSGGTSAKQISSEGAARKIGYGGMITEAVLALGVITAISVGLSFENFSAIVFPTAAGVKSNPVLGFALGLGGLTHKAFGLPGVYGTIFGILMVEGFVVTTLDTAVRLNRYLFEELWQVLLRGKAPAIMKSYLFNSGLCVVLMFIFAYNNAFRYLWPIFGSANQLLAALTLISVSSWLLYKGKTYWFTLIPGIFMLVTTIAALIYLLINKYIPGKTWMLVGADILLIALSIGVVFLARGVFTGKKQAIVTE